jgi:hypothetical protein
MGSRRLSLMKKDPVGQRVVRYQEERPESAGKKTYFH